MRASIPQSCRWTGGAIALATVAVSPWLFATTRAWSISIVSHLLLLGIVAWLLGSALQRFRGVQPRLAFGVLALAAIGFVNLATNPPASLDGFSASHSAYLNIRWPHAFVQWGAAEQTSFTILSLAALLVFSDLGRSHPARSFATLALSASGACIAALGLYQHYHGFQTIYGEAATRYPGYFFATFFHHSNAGAYLNLVWPLALQFSLPIGAASFGIGRKLRIGISAICGALVFLALATQLSRFAQALALLGLLALAAAALHRYRNRSRRAGPPPSKRVVAIAGLACAAVLGSSGYLVSQNPALTARWEMLADWLTSDRAPPRAEASNPDPATWPELMRPDGFISNEDPGFMAGRAESYQVAAAMIQDSGLFGAGAGAWKRLYHGYSDNPFLRTFYLHMQFVHSDFFQFVLEWGLVGGAIVGYLLLGGAIRSLRSTLQRADIRERSMKEICLPLAVILLMLHAIIDFPLQIPCILLTACALAGLCWAQAGDSAKPQPAWGKGAVEAEALATA